MTPLQYPQRNSLLSSIRLLAAPLLLVSLLVASTSAQSNTDARVWAAVALINHGERTPAIGGLETILTPLGAQQMWKQGRAFRSRYLGADGGSKVLQTNTTRAAPIQNLAKDAIDNSQLTILSQTDEWVAGGALAFLQGLYPPNTEAFNTQAGGKAMSTGFVTGANQTNYPLNGYQYPRIQSLSKMDNASVVIQGTVGCTAWDKNVNGTVKKDLANRAKESDSFYKTLFSTAPLQNILDTEQANFWNAFGIYELVNYMYTHNETVFKGLKDADETLKTLRANALDLGRAMNSDNKTDTDDSSNVLASIAGRTLAQQILDSFSNSIKQGGKGSKLTLMFADYQPLLAFFSIAGLLTHENMLSGPFSKLPEPGAAMVLELMEENFDSSSSSMPATEDLMIRFSYRASSDDDELFSTHALLGSGFGGQRIPYSAFLTPMQELARDSSQWCGICRPTAVPWCRGSSSKSGHGGTSNKYTVTPVLAGLIGAAVMGAVIGIVGLGLFAFGACRIGRSKHVEGSGPFSGGFKGAEKMASDVDVSIVKGGAHERIGSWELNEPGNKPSSMGSLGVVAAGLSRERSPRRRIGEDDDGISVTGATPVKAREGV